MNRNSKNIKENSYIANNKQSGMTLTELMVVIAIFILVTGLTFFDYGNFRSVISLQNLADDISLSIRKTQNYAIGVHSSSGVFSYSYGIHFSSKTKNQENKSIILFVDGGNNGYNSNDTKIDTLNITTDDVVSCIYTLPNDKPNCSNNNTIADIIFRRPNPEINKVCIGGSCPNVVPKAIIIQVKNNKSLDTKNITISNSGQITVQ